MEKIQEPLKTILRDFCHVEWFEIDELARIIKNGDTAFNASLLQKQMHQLVQASDIPLDKLNRVTANEFDSVVEAKKWLSEIFARIFEAHAM